MDRHTIILTADKRQEKLAGLLEGERVSYAWEENAQEKEVCEKVYVLPIPVTKLDRNPKIKEKLKEELKLLSLHKDSHTILLILLLISPLSLDFYLISSLV